MKEATGELNMTVVTIILIGAILAIFWLLFRNVQNTVEGQWNNTIEDHGYNYEDNSTNEITVDDYTMNF